MARSLLPSGSGWTGGDPFLSLQRGMNRLFEDLMRGEGTSLIPSEGEGALTVMPKMNVSETDDEIKITVELPGVNAKDVDITFDDGILTIRGEKKAEQKSEKENYHFVERSFGSFQRSLRVPMSVDSSNIQARVSDGVLMLTLPKNKEKDKTRHIEVQATS